MVIISVSLSTEHEHKRSWYTGHLSHLSVCRSRKCIVAKWLTGYGCSLGGE